MHKQHGNTSGSVGRGPSFNVTLVGIILIVGLGCDVDAEGTSCGCVESLVLIFFGFGESSEEPSDFRLKTLERGGMTTMTSSRLKTFFLATG